MSYVSLNKVVIVEHIYLHFDCLMFKAKHKQKDFVKETLVCITVTLENGELTTIKPGELDESYFNKNPLAWLTCQSEILEFLKSYQSKGNHDHHTHR